MNRRERVTSDAGCMRKSEPAPDISPAELTALAMYRELSGCPDLAALVLSKDHSQIGESVCRLTRGAWRKNEPTLDIYPAELDHALDCLVSMGAAPLIWPRIRHVLDSANTGTAKALQAAYHETVLDNKRFRPQLPRRSCLNPGTGRDPAPHIQGMVSRPILPPTGIPTAGRY